MDAVADGGAHMHSGTQSHRSTEGDSSSQASHVHTGQPVVLLSSGRMHGRHWTAGATLLSRGQNAGIKGRGQPRAKPGQLGGGPASWGPGAQCHHRVPDARWGPQDHLGHCVCPLTPLLSQGRGCLRHGQMWPAPPHTHISALLVPDTSRKKGGHGGREGGLSPEKGHCPLWESEPTCLYIVGPAAGLPTLGPWPGPSHVAAGGPLLLPAWHSLELARGLCVRLARQGYG